MNEQLATIGDNQPAAADVLQDELTIRHADLTARRDELLEAAARVPGSVDDDETAGKVADFVKQLTACVKNSDAARVSEKEPYLNGGRLVDGWFAKVKDPIAKAKKEIEARLTVYLRAKEAAERKAREEAERQAREEAAEALRKADEAAAKARSEADLDAAIDAEDVAHAAMDAAAKAHKDAEVKAAELSRTRGDLGSLGSLRTHWTGELIDRATLDLENLREHLPEDAINKAIRSFVKAGGRELAGAKIYEQKTAVVR